MWIIRLPIACYDPTSEGAPCGPVTPACSCLKGFEKNRIKDLVLYWVTCEVGRDLSGKVQNFVDTAGETPGGVPC